MTRTFGAPVGGRNDVIGGNFVLGSLASYVVRPTALRSGIGSTSRPVAGARGPAAASAEAGAVGVPSRGTGRGPRGGLFSSRCCGVRFFRIASFLFGVRLEN